MKVGSVAELKQASKLNVAEVIITDEALTKKVRIWQLIRTIASILVVIILALVVFAWANPLQIALLDTGGFRIARQAMLLVGIALLFLEFVLPGTRVFKIAGTESEGLRLVNRRK